MANTAKLLTVLTYFCLIVVNVPTINSQIFDKPYEDVNNNDGDYFDNNEQVQHTIAATGDDIRTDRHRRSECNGTNGFYKPLLDYYKNIAADDSKPDHYCDCTASDNEIIQVCINSFRVPLLFEESQNYFYGNATFKLGEIIHISCADTPRGISSLNVYGIAPSGIKVKVSPTINYQFISATYVKLKKDIVYQIICRTRNFEDDSLQLLPKNQTVVWLESGYSYTNPVKGLDLNFIVNGIILSPLCTTPSVNEIINYRYFTYPSEIVTVVIAKSKQMNASAVAVCDFKMTLLYFGNTTFSKISFAMKSERYTLKCTVPIVGSKLEESRFLLMVLRFENYRVTEPYVFGLSWSRIALQFKVHSEFYINYEVYNENEVMQLAWASNDSETKLLNYTYFWEINKLIFFHRPSSVKLEEAVDKYIAEKDTRQFDKTVNVYYQKFSLAPFPKNVKISIENDHNRCVLWHDQNSKKEIIEDGIAMAPMITYNISTSKPASSPPTLLAASENHSSAAPIITYDISTSKPTSSTSTLLAASENHDSCSKLTAILITAFTVLLVYILITVGVILVRRRLRAMQVNSLEPSVVYNRNSHQYETVQYHTNCDNNIRERPPCPLPPEALEENRPYLHYDTPYEWRLFRFGRQQRHTPKNRSSLRL